MFNKIIWLVILYYDYFHTRVGWARRFDRWADSIINKIKLLNNARHHY